MIFLNDLEKMFKEINFKKILNFSYVFWSGDLNFQLSTDFTANEIEELIKKNKLNQLLEYDELSAVRKSNEAFSKFNEEKITFPPTFKYYVGTQDFNKE